MTERSCDRVGVSTFEGWVRFLNSAHFAFIVQLAERLICNQLVAGSIPAECSKVV